MPDNVASIKMGNILCAVAQGFEIPETDYPAQQLLRYAIQVGYVERVESLKITPKGTARMRELGDPPTPPSVPTASFEEQIKHEVQEIICDVMCDTYGILPQPLEVTRNKVWVRIDRLLTIKGEAAHKAGLAAGRESIMQILDGGFPRDKVLELERVRAALELMVKELSEYGDANGLGPARLLYALSQGELALRATPAAPEGDDGSVRR